MRPMTLGEIAAVCHGTLAGGAAGDTLACGAQIDTRALRPGDLFAALLGQRDGHEFAADAIARGAVAVLAQRPVPAPHILVADVTTALAAIAAAQLAALRAGSLTVVALTGSVGKTTTKDLLAQLLARLGSTIAPTGSLNNHWGVPLTILRADESTRYLVLEMGANHVGEIAHLSSIAPPDVALELGVGTAHLGEFGSLEAIARAKRELVEGTVPGGIVVLNADNPPAAAMADAATGPIITFGRAAPGATDDGPDLAIHDVAVDDDGRVALTVSYRGAPGAPWPATRIQTGLRGAHNAVNVAAACAVAAALGLAANEAAAALNGVGPASPHRMAVADRPDGVRVIDDSYNANPDSMAAAIESLARYRAQGRRTIAVVGEMLELGAESARAHAAIGELAAARGIDHLIAIGAGAAPAARAIASLVRPAPAGGSGVAVSTTAHLVRDNVEAIRELTEVLRPSDVVLVKGSKDSGAWRVADWLMGRVAGSDG